MRQREGPPTGTTVRTRSAGRVRQWARPTTQRAVWTCCPNFPTSGGWSGLHVGPVGRPNHAPRRAAAAPHRPLVGQSPTADVALMQTQHQCPCSWPPCRRAGTARGWQHRPPPGHAGRSPARLPCHRDRRPALPERCYTLAAAGRCRRQRCIEPARPCDKNIPFPARTLPVRINLLPARAGEQGTLPHTTVMRHHPRAAFFATGGRGSAPTRDERTRSLAHTAEGEKISACRASEAWPVSRARGSLL